MTVTAIDRPDLADRAYAILSGDDDLDRACKAIPEAACTALPRNFLLNLANGAATKLAEQIASPGLVLAWLLGAIGAPVAFAGFLVPIRQAGALLPQLAAAARIRAAPRRKLFWVGAGTVQAMALAAMIPAVLILPPLAAGCAILVLLAVFSMASGVGSVAFQDVIGKTIPKARRGRLLAARATIGGALAVSVALFLHLGPDLSDRIWPILVLVGAAALLWLMGAGLFAAIEEEPGETGGGRNPLEEAREGLALVRMQRGYRAYLLARIFLVSVEIAMPFYAVLAGKVAGETWKALGLYILATGLGAILSSPFWGRFADRSSRRAMIQGGVIGAFAAASAVAIAAFAESGIATYLYALPFVIHGIAEGGVRLGRKTYLVDAAPAEERPLYVATGNTLIGCFTLASGLLGLLLAILGLAPMLALLGLLSLIGALAAWRMPEAAHMVD